MASMHPVASRLDTIQRRSSNSACEAPAEEKLFCSCSSLSASVALMVQPRVPVTVIETATAADLCYSCVRCVSFQSRARILRFWKKNCRRECDCIRFAKWLRGAARNALAAEGRRSEFFYRRPYLTSRRRRSRCAAPRRRPANESTCRRVESSSFRGKSCRQGSSYFKLNRDGGVCHASLIPRYEWLPAFDDSRRTPN